MATFSPEGYTAFGSFHPPYIAVERFFFQHKDWHTQRVFHVLSIHADAIGCSFIGLRGIANLAGMSETNAWRAMLRLSDLGWLRAHAIDIPSRRQRQIDWQLSPAALYIAPDHIAEAMAVWERAQTLRNEIINQQPEILVNQNQNQQQQPSPENQNQNHHHHQNQSLQSSEPLLEGKDNVDPETDPPTQREAPSSSGESRHEPAVQNRGSAPPPPDLERCRLPLEDAEAEDCAGTVQLRLNTRLVQARQLVLWFGILKVTKAIEWLDREMADGFRPRSKFGLVRKWLEDDIIQPDDGASVAERKRYISGQYADHIQS